MNSKARASLFCQVDFDNKPNLNNLKIFALAETGSCVNVKLTSVNLLLLTVNKMGAP
jgi:hypothetical protein